LRILIVSIDYSHTHCYLLI